MKPIVDFYIRIIPAALRYRISMIRNSGGLDTIRRDVLRLYKDSAKKDVEIAEVLNYLKRKPLRIFPYAFVDDYNPKKIEVLYDESNGLHYVMHENKKLYFKRTWSSDTIRGKYNDLLIEQDHRSPHCYLNNDFFLESDDMVADIGAAEGIFALSVIEKVQKVFLFETDLEWIEALTATFKPWGNKIEIIHKFVSETNDSKNCSLDEFCASENMEFSMLKVDVDGAELALINGADAIFSTKKKIKIAICTYHNAIDESQFRKVFEDRFNMKVQPSLGYMIFHYDPCLSAPYLRRGLIRAKK
ncbi:MAG: dimethyladenosine transferase [Burkholderiales bacterium]|nr:dimethyladenosine transferase [Bacteroidia bacterium]